MEYKFVTSILTAGVKELGKPAANKVVQLWDVDEVLKDLVATYEKTRALIDAQEEAIENREGCCLKNSLQELEGCWYDTEDLIDYLSQFDTGKGSKPIRKLVFKHIKLWTTPHEIGDLSARLNRVSSRIEGVLNASSSKSGKNTRCKPPWDNTPLVFGASREQDKNSIIKELTSPGSCGVSIIGMDGLGKTGLARAILEDPGIKRHFARVLYASVSGDFQTEEIFSNFTSTDLGGIQGALVVLDDLWSVTELQWFSFIHSVPISSLRGWKILTTTRNPKVAKVTKSKAHFLDTLADADFTKFVLRRPEMCGINSKIWEIDVNEIAKKCKGMPVLALNFELLLSRITDVCELAETIKQLKSKDFWELTELGDVLPFLKLNHPKLPVHLNRCFAYCSLFDPNHTFSREELIQLWEMEGFVQPEQRKISFPTGNECFDELVSRSILKSTCSNQKTRYKMHELHHEFAQRVASVAYQRIDEGQTSLPSSCECSLRHLSLNCDNIDSPLLKELEKCRGLRTILSLDTPRRRCVPYHFFYELKSLRSLNLSHTNICLQKSLAKLKLLRYLNLTNTNITTLPDSILNLHVLQVLKLEQCPNLVQLPTKLYQIISLRGLYVSMKGLASLPSKLGMLTNLEILSSYVVGRDEGYKVEELKNMNNLEQICISHLESIKGKTKAQKCMLRTKARLEKLVLEWDNPTADQVDAGGVLEGLEPHQDLKELTLRNYRGMQFPAWLISSPRKLESLSLQKCPDIELLPCLGKLALLKTLVLHSVGNFERIDEGFCGRDGEGFKSLENLEFNEMGSLVSWTGLKKGDMPRLHKFRIISCEKLTSLPSLIHQGCLMYLEIDNCPVLESLPELAPSMNADCANLIIKDSPLVKDTRQLGETGLPVTPQKARPLTFSLFGLKRLMSENFLQVQHLPGNMMGNLPQGVEFNGRHIWGICRLYWVVLLVATLIPFIAIMY